MSSAASELERHIARLHGNGRLRVWSLIITFFGDAVALRGGRVALSTLQDAMGLLDIEPGAVGPPCPVWPVKAGWNASAKAD